MTHSLIIPIPKTLVCDDTFCLIFELRPQVQQDRDGAPACSHYLDFTGHCDASAHPMHRPTDGRRRRTPWRIRCGGWSDLSRNSATALRFVPSVRPFCWTRARPARLDLPNASCVEMELKSELSVSPDLAVLRTSAVKYSASPLCPPQC